MIKILYILEATSGGTQKHVIDIAKRIDKSEYQIDIIYSTNRNKHFTEISNGTFNRMYGLPIRRGASFTDILNIWRIYKIIKQNGYDIIHCHSTKAGFVGRLAASLSRHKNIIYSPHGFMFCDTRIKLRRYSYLLLEKYLGFLTRKVIAVSGSERELALHHNIVPDRKIITINNSVDPSEYDDYNYLKSIPDRLNGFRSEIILGTVGRLYYQKDPLTLIRSFKIINDKIPKTKLILVGDGPLEDECIQLVKDLGLEAKVSLEGYQKDSRSYYKKFDIFVLSSHYEGMPYALLEAMSMGIPAVGTNVVGIKDLIAHGETGYLVQEENYVAFADAVIKLIENPEDLIKYSLKAKTIARNNFNFTEGIKEYQNFYSSLCLGSV
jgi:glycosyltransferase involved in cell wall biosynthesis